jgi:hypothetical protein
VWVALVVIAFAVAEVLERWIRERGETQRHRIAEEARTAQLRIRQAGKPDSAQKSGLDPGSVSRLGELGPQRGSESVLPGQGYDM